MINFIGNSIKFTENGYIFIEISDYDDNTICIKITDTGSGIAKEK